MPDLAPDLVPDLAPGAAWNPALLGLAARSAARRARRRPIRSLLTVLEVALGTAAVAVALTLVQGRVAGEVPPDVFQIVTGEAGKSAYDLFRSADLEALRALAPAVSSLTVFDSITAPQLDLGPRRFRVAGGAYAGPEYAALFGLEFTRGAFYGPVDLRGGTPPVVLSEGVARAVFADADPVGRAVALSDAAGSGTKTAYRVVGVFKDLEPWGGGVTPGLLVLPGERPVSSLFVRAHPGRAIQAQSQLLAAVRQTYRGDPGLTFARGALHVSRIGDGPISADELHTDPTLFIFIGFGVLTLAVSMIGIFSSALVASVERTREVGLRRALGASQGQVLLELVAESGLVALVGAALGAALAAGVLRVVRGVTGPFLFSRGLEFSPLVALEVVGLVLAVGVLLGLYPAVLAARMRPVEALREAR